MGVSVMDGWMDGWDDRYPSSSLIGSGDGWFVGRIIVRCRTATDPDRRVFWPFTGSIEAFWGVDAAHFDIDIDIELLCFLNFDGIDFDLITMIWKSRRRRERI